MDQEKNKRHIIDILFVLALFCLFVMCAIFLITIGAKIYNRTIENMQYNYESRTSFAYVTEKVRQADQADAISVGTFADCPALILSETINDTLYHTYLYAYDGQLMELMSKADISLAPSSGQKILEISDFAIEQLSENLYTFSITTTDQMEYSLYISSHCTETQRKPL